MIGVYLGVSDLSMQLWIEGGCFLIIEQLNMSIDDVFICENINGS